MMPRVKQQTNFQPFECVDTIDDYDENDESVQSRIDVLSHDFGTIEEDDYETVVVCETRNRTLHPKALNSVNNHLISVVNTKEIVQSIKTEECL